MLEQFFVNMEQWPISKAIGESLWVYPLVQALHLVAMAFFMGAVLILNLRLLGIGISNSPLAQVARSARPWLIGGFLTMVLTGLPQLMQNASREYYSEYFWRKMYFLLAALIFTAITVRYMKNQPEGASVRGATKFVAAVSLFLWANVIVAARLIGLFT
jgi:hypothetical protein